MKEKLSRYFSGAVRLEIEGDNRERFVNMCRSSEIYIWDICFQNKYCLCVSVDDFFRLKSIIKKTKVKTKIKEKYGLPFFLYKYRKRKMFAAGIATSFVLIYILSLFIWDLEVEGNFSHSDEEIIAFLNENHVFSGIKKERINCDEIEKEIRNHYFDVTWVSVEVTGTRLIVHMKENEEELLTENDKNSVLETGGETYNLVSAKDAVITNIVMRNGTAAVTRDMEVKEGDVLVYGYYEVLNDEKEKVRTQYLKADADIYGKVVYDYNYDLPLHYTKKVYDEKEKTFLSLRMGNKAFGIEKEAGEQQDVVTEEQQITLYEDFCIPVFLVRNTYKNFEIKEFVYSEEEAKQVCEEKLSYFIEKIEKSTIQIIANDVTIEVNGDICQSRGNITVIENIGKLVKAERQEEMTGESINNNE
ncbi:MAG: sporulation protein YqfD [Lachnospiraceae bacterium]|nr:sporulation protein YqfD [Lachnospiraceae bacterium]